MQAFAQVRHRVPMLSLDNTYSEEEVTTFYARISRLLPSEKIPVVIVYGDKESDEALAVREHGGEQSTKSLEDIREYLATL